MMSLTWIMVYIILLSVFNDFLIWKGLLLSYDKILKQITTS
jgi:hypothetical protein